MHVRLSVPEGTEQPTTRRLPWVTPSFMLFVYRVFCVVVRR